MRRKANESVTKLMTTDINTNQAYLYFNIYFISSIYFGFGIIELNQKQEVELKWIYEAPILRKIGLSSKFPKELIYARRSTLGVGLIAPNTALATATLKLYIENKRMGSKVNEIIQINEEYNHILSGQAYHLISLKIN